MDGQWRQPKLFLYLANNFDAIEFEKPKEEMEEIKSLGKFKVKISLHSEIDAEILIIVESAETIQ